LDPEHIQSQLASINPPYKGVLRKNVLIEIKKADEEKVSIPHIRGC